VDFAVELVSCDQFVTGYLLSVTGYWSGVVVSCQLVIVRSVLESLKYSNIHIFKSSFLVIGLVSHLQIFKSTNLQIRNLTFANSTKTAFWAFPVWGCVKRQKASSKGQFCFAKLDVFVFFLFCV